LHPAGTSPAIIPTRQAPAQNPGNDVHGRTSTQAYSVQQCTGDNVLIWRRRERTVRSRTIKAYVDCTVRWS